MDEYLILGSVFLLSLLFLTVIFGDRLSLFGLKDGRWLTAPLELASWFWDMVCEAADRVWCFIFDHFWWVAATASGSMGVLLIALLLATGLSEQAEADRNRLSSLTRAGSVLDHIPVVDADDVLQINAEDTPSEIDHLVYQVPSAIHRFKLPEDIRKVITDFGDPGQTPIATDVPPLETDSSPYLREPIYSRSRLSLTMEPFVERYGRRLKTDTEQLIRNSLYMLRGDDWRTFSLAAASGRQPRRLDTFPLPQDPQFEVDTLERGIRVIPGDAVMENDISVEKSAPYNATTGEFEISIRVTNKSRQILDGLIVREMLPATWQATDMQPRGAYRESIATWLIQNLRPDDTELLTLRVAGDEPGRFQSYTEVSATAAVVATAGISARRPPPPVERSRPIERTDPVERSLPPVEQLPDVRLTLIEPPAVVPVNENVDVLFQVRNIGNAPARGIMLRVNLPPGLDHHDLQPDSADRFVDARVRELAPNERRQMRLTVLPRTAGSHLVTAELLLQKMQLDRRAFDVKADMADNGPSLRPQPDAGFQ